eukprot:4403278-Karenia_brevis.AAC.1
MYDTLATLKKETIAKKMLFMIGADCNAQVGQRSEHDSKRHIGPFGLIGCNARGQWLKGWAASHDLVLANTHFEKPPHKT